MICLPLYWHRNAEDLELRRPDRILEGRITIDPDAEALRYSAWQWVHLRDWKELGRFASERTAKSALLRAIGAQSREGA